ncbi:MAG: PKD domain-containing protein [Euryarchaeota archaeon]|nr:PKD domain-containing protein [Euryarchaeota archaeon]MDE1837901.1 PKD domain-containing protein [Euryarchaeota archaeon]MDE1881281.1 PKD domain-containing protein [Euryarchaeota archaeon]MDE2046261.1 PKD domain-containing protein [Thermoplasmata archaeon]
MDLSRNENAISPCSRSHKRVRYLMIAGLLLFTAILAIGSMVGPVAHVTTVGAPRGHAALVAVVPATLSASVSATPTSGAAPLNVSFTGSASGGAPPYTWSWNFGDSNASSQNPTYHVYTWGSSTFMVSLLVTDSAGSMVSAHTNISVGAALYVSAAANPSSGTAPLTVNFASTTSGGLSPYTYSWSFGDGLPGATTPSAQHTYQKSGTYLANVTVSDASGQTVASNTLSIFVGQTSGGGNGTTNLTAYINAKPTAGAPPLMVAFLGSASGGTSPYTFSWSFGDGSNATGSNLTHIYSQVGVYVATLYVTDSAGGSVQSSTVINVSSNSSALVAYASASPSSGPAPLNVTFYGSTSGGAGSYQYSWDFGDGSNATGAPNYHVYTSNGIYHAVLFVLDSLGNSANASVLVAVGTNITPLSVQASASPSSGQAPLVVSFTSVVNGGVGPFSYGWSFGDGATSSLTDPSHTYSSSGVYQATVKVIDAQGNAGSASVWVNVNGTTCQGNCSGSLQAFASASATSGASPLTTTFYGGASGGSLPYTYLWQFGDGQGAAVQDPTHTYQGAGTFLASVDVSDAAGSLATSFITISVSGGGCSNCTPVPALTVPATSVVGQTVSLSASVSAVGTFHYAWSFGDGTTLAMTVYSSHFGTVVQAQHTYLRAGTYHVAVVVSGGTTPPSSATSTISVHGTPVTPVSHGLYLPWVLPLVGVVIAAVVLVMLAMYYRGRRKVQALPASGSALSGGVAANTVLDPYSAYREAYLPPSQTPPSRTARGPRDMLSSSSRDFA